MARACEFQEGVLETRSGALTIATRLSRAEKEVVAQIRKAKIITSNA
jgi:hypothetical protein